MKSELQSRIENSTAHTKNRNENALFCIENEHLIPDLFDYAFNINHKSHIRACCILDTIFELKLDLALPYLEIICSRIENLKNDSAIRSVSRILRLIVIDNDKKCNSHQDYLTDAQIEKIITSSFDWLISDYRVAVKHSAIVILFVLSKKQNWISDELKIILEKDAPLHSIAYKKLAKKVLRNLE